MKCNNLVYVAIVGFALFLTGCKSEEEKVAEFVASGNTYLGNEEFDAAKIEFRNALQIDEHNLGALQGIAEIAERDQQWPELYRVLAKIVEVDPNNEKARWKRLNIMFAAGILDEALSESDVLMDLAPERLEVKILRANILFRMGQAHLGLNQAEQVLQQDSANVPIRVITAAYFAEQRNFDKALEELNAGIVHDPDHKQLNVLKATVLNQQGELQQALAVLQFLVSEHPEAEDLHKMLAQQWVQLNEKSKAEQVMREFAARNPTESAHLAFVEVVNLFNGEEAAIAQLKDYIADYPEQTELQFVLVDFYLRAKNRDLAKAKLEQLDNEAESLQVQTRAKISLAELASVDGEKDRRSQLYQQVMAMDPQNVDAHVGLARIELENGAVDKAVQDLRSALKFAPNAAELHLALANAHEKQNLPDLAEDHYSKSLESAGDNPKYTWHYARFLINRNNNDFAEDILTRAIKQRIADGRILALLAQVKLNQGKWDEAQYYADELDKAGAQGGIVNRIRGIAFAGNEDYEESIESFKLVEQATPGSLRPMATLVAAYLKAGKIAEARAFINSTLQEDPRNAHAHMLSGMLYEQMGELASAEKAYKQALQVDANVKDVYRRLIKLLLARGKDAEALEVVRSAQKSLENDAGMAVSEALIHQRRGEIDTAIAVYREILQRKPNFDIAHNNLALLLLEQGGEANKAEALAIAERFRNSKIPHFQDSLGWIYLQTGNKIEALYLLERAAEGLTGHPEVHYHLGMAYLANDRKLEAKRELHTAVESSQSLFDGREDAVAVLERLKKN